MQGCFTSAYQLLDVQRLNEFELAVVGKSQLTGAAQLRFNTFALFEQAANRPIEVTVASEAEVEQLNDRLGTSYLSANRLVCAATQSSCLAKVIRYKYDAFFGTSGVYTLAPEGFCRVLSLPTIGFFSKQDALVFDRSRFWIQNLVSGSRTAVDLEQFQLGRSAAADVADRLYTAQELRSRSRMHLLTPTLLQQLDAMYPFTTLAVNTTTQLLRQTCVEATELLPDPIRYEATIRDEQALHQFLRQAEKDLLDVLWSPGRTSTAATTRSLVVDIDRPFSEITAALSKTCLAHFQLTRIRSSSGNTQLIVHLGEERPLSAVQTFSLDILQEFGKLDVIVDPVSLQPTASYFFPGFPSICKQLQPACFEAGGPTSSPKTAPSRVFKK